MTSKGATIDVGAWLRGLGLGEYEATFRDNAINEKILPNLTAEDLKDMGIGIVGHRRMLLDAIAALSRDANVKASPPEATSTLPKPPQEAAERRQVTVLFSDIVGSTALSARMDPEDLREVISAYQKRVAETVQSFGGFVAKYMGDGVLVYFGYPQAHEDDAERAVRAGLDLVTSVSGLKIGAALQTRVGVATGLVVVGDLIGSGVSQEQAIVGETPNLAARLQGIAEPNAVVIAESTRKLVGNLFELQDLGAQDLKGVAGPVRAWGALRPSSVESRFEALHAGGLTELVGREEEVELLLRRWSKAKAGEGQVVLLSGEPGIGKSRLTAAMMDRLTNEPHTRLRYFCSPQHTDSALYPDISQMERAAGFAHDDTAQAKLDKLDALLTRSFTPRQDASLLAEMLSLPNDGRYPILELAPQQRRQKTLEALMGQLEALARAKPVLMIFEDVHWVDPTSLELLGRTVDQLRTLGVLLIITYRPEFEAPWIGRSYVTTLNLNRLGEREIAAMVDRVTGNKRLPESVKQDIIERTDGIPLFVEEMTKAVLEGESEGRAWETAAAVPLAATAVPASLHASLMARLDRLGPAKEIAQIGAAIGREFSHPLIAAVSRKEEPQLKSALESLVQAGLLFRQGVPPHASYLFKHALVQSAAYGTLLRGPRQALHANIGAALEERFPGIGEVRPEIVAQHYTDGGLDKRAISYWYRAGEESVAKSAVFEAVGQLQKGLFLVPNLADAAERDRDELKFQVALGTALMAAKGYAHSEVVAAFSRARELLISTGNSGTQLEFSILWGLWMAAFGGGDAHTALKQAEELLAVARSRGDSTLLVVAHRLLGSALVQNGDYRAGLPHLQRAAELYNPAEHRGHAFQFAQDIGVSVFSHLAWALWHQGYADQAKNAADEALQQAWERAHAHNLAFAHYYASFIMLLSRRTAEAEYLANVLVDVATKHRMAFWLGWGLILQGSVMVQQGDVAAAIEQIRKGSDEALATGSRYLEPFHLGLLAEALAVAGDTEEELAVLSRAVAAAEASGQKGNYAELQRLRGESMRRLPEPNLKECEACFRSALAIAQRQGARGFELRAAMSMARLWRDQGKPQQARELLAPVYGWFTEGFDTVDLKEAKALLDELAHQSVAEWGGNSER